MQRVLRIRDLRLSHGTYFWSFWHYLFAKATITDFINKTTNRLYSIAMNFVKKQPDNTHLRVFQHNWQKYQEHHINKSKTNSNANCNTLETFIAQLHSSPFYSMYYLFYIFLVPD